MDPARALSDGVADPARAVARAVRGGDGGVRGCGSGDRALRARAHGRRTRVGRRRSPAVRTNVEVIELPIDDSWLRDSGPIFVLGPDGARTGVDFRFNAWGERFFP